MACTAPTMLLPNAAPAMHAATAMSMRASRAARLPCAAGTAPQGLSMPSAAGSASRMMRSAAKARASLMGLRWSQVHASMAWHMASRPVAAVTRGGSDCVMRGSRKAASGIMQGEIYSSLTPRVGWRMTATGVHSLPVPAVVGTAMNGTRAPRGQVLAAHQGEDVVRALTDEQLDALGGVQHRAAAQRHDAVAVPGAVDPGDLVDRVYARVRRHAVVHRGGLEPRQREEARRQPQAGERLVRQHQRSRHAQRGGGVAEIAQRVVAGADLHGVQKFKVAHRRHLPHSASA